MAWLITSAIASELDTLRAFVAKASEDDGLVRGRIGSQRVVLAPLGIGSVETAITLTRLLPTVDFERVYFLGTAGILPGFTREIGEAVAVNRVMPARAPGERLVGAAYNNIDCPLTTGDEGVNVWCANGVSETRELAEHAAKFAAHVENMELWGVARTAIRHEVPFGAFLGLSNQVGPKAGEQWQEHGTRAAAAACQLMASHLKETAAA